MLHTRNNTAGARLSASITWLVILLLAMPSLTVWSAPAAPAVTPILVTTTADDFNTGLGCSLREAIQSANTGSNFGGCIGASATANTITLPAGTYTLTGASGEDSNASGDLDIDATVTINGEEAKTTIIQAGTDVTNGVDRVLHILDDLVEINEVTIRYGKAPDGIDGAANETCSGEHGGGIRMEWDATLVLNGCVVHYNRAGASGNGCTASSPFDRTGGFGGGIYNVSTLELNSTRVMHNEAGAGGAGTVAGTLPGLGGDGGGIYLAGPGSHATLTKSALNLNSAGAGGRGADASSGDAGDGGYGGSGGGVYSLFGSLSLIESTISGNTTGDAGDGGDSTGGNGGDGGYSGDGAGILAYGATVEAVESVLSGGVVGLPGSGGSGTGSDGLDGGRGMGGSLEASNGSDVTLTDTTVKDNTASTGGGVYGGGSSTVVTLDGCTVSGNHAYEYGGGLYGGGGATLVLTNSTISGNTADGHGGGIYNGATMTLTFVTVAYNTADADGAGDPGDGGGFFAGGTFAITNTIVAENSDVSGQNPDCHSGYGGSTTSGDYNLLGIGDSTNCNLASLANDLVGTAVSPIDPLLGTLGDKGGPTWTHSLNLSSPAVGYIPNGVNGCVPGIRDQRGVLRFPPCNIGAFEADRVDKVYLPLIVKP